MKEYVLSKEMLEFLDDMAHVKEARPKTLRAYRETLAEAYKFSGMKPPKQWTSEDGRAYMRYLGNGYKNRFGEVMTLTPRSKRRNRSILTSFFKYIGKIEVMSGTMLPKIPDEDLPRLTKEEADACGESYNNDKERLEFAVWWILRDCGLRASEVVNLDVSDITQDEILIRDAKGGKDRRVWFDYDETYPAIMDYVNNHRRKPKQKAGDPLFVNEWCIRFNPIKVDRVVREACARNDIDKHITAHSMRRTAAKQLWKDKGLEPEIIMVKFGHSKITTTYTYLGISYQDAKDKALEIAKNRRKAQKQ